MKMTEFLVTAWRHHLKCTKRCGKVVWVWIYIDSYLVILEKFTGENSIILLVNCYKISFKEYLPEITLS